ncbi:MAG TPA: hypothetical protein VFF20_00590 [Pseudogracilibacillus sp.]|nr:hypothetical protein [Pseudogracilibacillus sp.]
MQQKKAQIEMIPELKHLFDQYPTSKGIMDEVSKRNEDEQRDLFYTLNQELRMFYPNKTIEH